HAEYEAQRAANRLEELRRLEKASASDPVIGQLVQQRQDLFHEQVRAAFASPTHAQVVSDALTRTLAQINAALKQHLLAAHFPADYLQPVYRCARCRDTGYTGEPIREQCPCLRERLFSIRCADTGLGLNPLECFEQYQAEIFPNDAPIPGYHASQRAYMDRIRAVCEQYAEDYPKNEKPNLLFFGPSGLGKTFLMNCIGQRVLARGHTPLKTTAYHLMDCLRENQFGRGDTEQYHSLMDAPLLMIDDMGTEPMLENVTLVQWFNLLNERALQHRHTIFSTNFSTAELQSRYTERVCSRLMDTRRTMLVRFAGQDVRLRVR
ncbi:MAG: ATP-binding protein, partial [Clostridia bacterium]